jgi:hypothetical protein
MLIACFLAIFEYRQDFVALGHDPAVFISHHIEARQRIYKAYSKLAAVYHTLFGLTSRLARTE